MENIIEKNKEKVFKNRELYEKSEQSVRAHLIEPVLNKLGWITSDPDFVIPNSRTSENDIPDYTLMYNGKEITYVEAKKITQNLRPNIAQLARYCTNQGIEYGILTDGMKWILFKAFEVGKKIEDRIIWEIDFEKDSNEEIEMRLTTITCDNFQNVKALSNKNDKLIGAWEEINNNPTKLKDAFIEIVKSDLENSGYSFELNEIENFVISKLQSQTKIFIKENNEIVSTIDNLPSSSDGGQLKVTFLDGGHVINKDKAIDTFIETIRKLGIENVRKIQKDLIHGAPLISDSPMERYKKIPNSNYYINGNNGTDAKKTLLLRVSEKLNVKITVEKVK